MIKQGNHQFLTGFYENNEEQDLDMDDFNAAFDIPFGDQTDGGVVFAKYTIKNDTDEDLSYMLTVTMTYDDAEKGLDDYASAMGDEGRFTIGLDDEYTDDEAKIAS